MDIRKPRALTPLVAESEATLVGASQVGDRIILSYLGDAKSEARMVTLGGQPVAEINLADIGSASGFGGKPGDPETFYAFRSEEHTSELQSLMRISYAVFCLKKKKDNKQTPNN